MATITQAWGPRVERYLDQMLVALRVCRLSRQPEWRDQDLPTLLMAMEQERGQLLADLLQLERAVRAEQWLEARNLARGARTRCVGIGNAAMMLFDWLVENDDPRSMRVGE